MRSLGPCRRQGQRAERVHDMALQIPGRCCSRCNATLIQGWPAVEQYKLTPDKVGHLLQLAGANAGTPAKTLWFCACSSPPGSHYEPVAMRPPPPPLHWWDGEPSGGEEKGRSGEHGTGIQHILGRWWAVSAIYYLPLWECRPRRHFVIHVTVTVADGKNSTQWAPTAATSSSVKKYQKINTTCCRAARAVSPKCLLCRSYLAKISTVVSLLRHVKVDAAPGYDAKLGTLAKNVTEHWLHADTYFFFLRYFILEYMTTLAIILLSFIVKL